MPRKAKVKIEIGNINSLQSLCEDIYHDLYTQRTQVINDLSKMINQVELKDDTSINQIYKTRAILLGTLISNSSTKLTLAKLLSTTLGESTARKTPKELVSLEQFSLVRKLLNENKQELPS